MTRRLAALGALLVLLILGGLALHEPRAEGITGWRAELFVAVLAAAAAAYFLSVLFLLRGARPNRATLWIVLGVAIAMRLPPLLAPPFLSSDLNRYIWDGRVQQAGINPYVYLPADPALASLRDDMIYPHVYRADYAPTIYPPMAQLIFAAIARIAETRFAVKLTMLGFEALALFCVALTLRRAGLSETRLLIYAWNPVAAWAFAGNGHVDAAAIGFIGCALLARGARRDGSPAPPSPQRRS